MLKMQKLAKAGENYKDSKWSIKAGDGYKAQHLKSVIQ